MSGVESSMASDSQPQNKKQKIEEEEGDYDKDDGKETLRDPSLDEGYTNNEQDFYSSSDEDWTNEAFKEYIDAVVKSKGFYIPKVPKGVKVSAYRAVPEYDMDWLAILAQVALNWYNNKGVDNENYKLKEVQHGSQRADRGILYYIAFFACGVDSGCEVQFRAKVLSGIDEEYVVDSCEKLTPDGC